MRQAGRYLPEYREVRSRVDFLQLCRTPELAAEVTVQPVDRLGVDAAILFSDILVVFDAMGVSCRFEPGPRIDDPVRSSARADALRWGDPEVELRYVFDAVAASKRALDDRVPLIGFCGAPFTVLSYLVEGETSRDFHHVKALLYGEPALFGRLMERLTELLARYLLAQVKAGADAVQIFDSWAGALGPRDYREHVLPHLRVLVERVRDAAPVIAFCRGNAHHLACAAELPAQVIGVDWTIELDAAIDVVGEQRVVQGNLDPGLLFAPAATLEARARSLVAAGRRARAHVFNLGHGISPRTDPALAKLLVDAVHGA
jgi:uroporphyrinogen decarboxylase